MDEKQFKYNQYLNPIANCPPSECLERERDAFRWVHSHPTADDFVPIPLMQMVDRRPIDTTDLNQPCDAFSLSLWNTREKAIAKLSAAISNRPPDARAQYIEDKGGSVACIRLKPNHGVASEPNKKGHFSLFEYVGVELYTEIIEIVNIFGPNG